jgi:ankyrin repeat protein
MTSEAMQALYQGDVERARVLLPADEGLDVFHAAAFGRADRLRELLADDPALARGFSGDGFTALHLAVFAEQGEAAQILIDAGADPNAVSTGEIAQVPPLGTARFVQSDAMERLLLDAGATPI